MNPGTVSLEFFFDTSLGLKLRMDLSYSINISHGGLRLNGQLCQYEMELEAWRKEQSSGTVSSAY
jgi:hypothetical protein